LLRRRTATDLSGVLGGLDTLKELQKQADRTAKDEIARNRLESAEQARGLREELQGSLKGSTDSLVKSVNGISAIQQQRLEDFAKQQKLQFDSFAAQLKELTEKNEKKSDDLRSAVENRLGQLQTENAKKLEEMRQTVDEKLQSTLDRRLGESF